MKLGYVRPLPTLTAATQIKALLKAGYDERHIIVEGRQVESLALLLEKLRPGDELGLYKAFVLATPKKKTIDRPRDTLWDAVRAIKLAKATVLEVYTGRICTDSLEYDDMIRDAIDHLSGNSGKGRGGSKSTRTYTDEQWAAAKREWFDLRHATNQDAVDEAIKKHGMEGFDRHRAYRKFKKSGR